MARVTPALVTALGVAMLCGALPRPAGADEQSDKAQCAKAYEGTQRERKAGKLRAAREQAAACRRSACAGFIVSDCTRWLGEIDALMPSVVFGATHGEGKDITDVSVYVDDKLLLDRLTGLAVNVDPGRHTFRFEREGSEPIEKKIVIREGEKARFVRVEFPRSSAAAATADGRALPPADAQHAEPDRTLAYLLAGAGVVAIGAFAYLGATGVHDEQAARSGASKCAPDCAPSRVDSIKRKYLYADVSLGIGAVCIGLATYLLVQDAGGEAPQSAESARRVHVDLAPTAHGAVGALSGRF